MKTNQTILFASWNSAQKMSDGKFQNPGMCNERVEALGKMLLESNY